MTLKNITRFITDDLNYRVMQALKAGGTYKAEEVMPRIEESMTIEQATVFWAFLEWVHSNGKKFNRTTIYGLMLEFYEEAADSNVKAYIDGKIVEIDLDKITLVEVQVTDFKPRNSKS
ncbi:hypothetical protein J4N45_10500 [Vibrio sp. SCSIO 43140]|uniref:hypothetical protein n=1 Tax=Vibrio sp. SCSIO 43140 TaxID=2819100 RepID=UPI002075549D|nr:hypothetical protein [Vibrio sp. SCSIO 43140]USD58960.1 hypothetical protein J4N45_10500 [Vibrio sp. SCSIO 43140]